MLRWIFALAVLAMPMLVEDVRADSDIIIRFSNESSDGRLVEANAPLRTTELQIVSERAMPEACFTFNRPLDRAPKVAMQNYVQVEPAIEIAATIRDRVLCIEGFAHGHEYKVTLLTGLPGIGGSLTQAEEHQVKVGSMRPSVAFASEGLVLPRLGNEGLPIRTVNIDRVQVAIARVNDRNLINRVRSGDDQYGSALAIGGREGEPVWSGELLVDNAPNKPIITALPINQTVGALKPGLYVATASAPKGQDLRDDEDDRIPPTSQWFVVSDLGLTSFVGSDGLLVQVRSLQTAQPVAGAIVALLSRNNKELTRIESDADGFARFDPGMVRGEGGNRAAAIYAYGAEGEFSFLGLEGPALDLSDRGVGGRPIPGPLDAFAYAERGIYRPGETANVAFLLRDDHAKAAGALPLIVKISSPDGVEIDRRTLTDQGGGSYLLTLALPITAKSGQWTVTAQASPEGETIGSTSFEVGDFVPPRIEFDLSTSAAIAKRGTSTPIDIAARYLYGAPAADLTGELAVVIRKAQQPYPAFAGYRFGREQDADTPPIQIDPAKMVTDAKGHVSSEFELKALPDTTQPLEAIVYATLFDVGGRPVKRNLTIPIETRPLVIGLKPSFSGDYVDRDALLDFDVVALDPQGNAIEGKGLTWELVKVFEEWELYTDINGNVRWQRIERDSPRIAGGTIDIAAGQPTRIEQQVGRGRYRLEVFDLATGAATSIGFYAGWWSSTQHVAAAPDQVEVTLQHAAYAPGAAVKAFVKPPYDSDVVLTVVDRGIRQTLRRTIPAAGADVTFTLPEDTTAGVYLVANAFAPADPDRSELPQRAIGATWVPIDQSLRKLTIAIDGPDVVEPNQTIGLPITVTGSTPGTDVFLTLAAVDDGVLQLTDFASPDPLPYYFGKRQLGGDLRDLYGSLIDPLGARRGTVRSGGDGVSAPQSRQFANAPKRNTEVVSLFSGVAHVDADGHATVPLKLPDFNGRLRLMAVAWSPDKVGGASRMLTVRAPIVAELSMPLFLAPGDRADLTLSLNNLAGPAGEYIATLESDGTVAIGATSNHARRIKLAPNGSYRTIRGLYAIKAGEGQLHLTLIGPDGFVLERDWHITVRPQNPIEVRRMVATLAPGQDLKLDWSVADGLFRDTATIDLTVGSVPDFGTAIVGQLSRDPYYWTSNMVSRAAPLLYFGDTYRALGLGNQERQAQRMEAAIDEILGSQVARGTFAPNWIYWSDQEEEWLTAYVLDFLTRAHEQGARIPELGYRRGIRWMTRFVSQDRTGGHDLAVEAYAYYVLARSGNMDAGRLRRFFEARGDKLPTALARAQIGAALARLGDLQMAAAAFDSIEQAEGSLLQLVGGDRRGSSYDYATPLRERAAIITMMAESGVVDRTKVTTLAASLAKDVAATKYLGAQEMAWLLYLAEALNTSAEQLDIAIDGQPLPTLSAREQPYLRRMAAAGSADTLATIHDTSDRSAYLTVSATGNPIGDLPPEENGFSIARKVVDRFGNPVDLNVIHQNDLLVVIIEGQRLHAAGGQTTVVDMLPSGFEIQNVKFDKNDNTDRLAWLGELSILQQAEYRDDRFVATADIHRYYWDYEGRFRMAYMVRAVTPGEFTMAGIYVEDLFRPNAFARGPVTHIRILPAHP